MTAPNPPEDVEVAPPLDAGRYRLVARIGHGGMASVFRAWDERLEVWRAIKVLGPSASASTSLRARFEQEARTMARLRHRHVLAVYDIGVDGNRPFMVMDLAVASLQDHLEAHGPLAPRQAATVMRAVLDALERAHAEQVVHRDIKPANLLVDADGTTLVADFGIAHLSRGVTREGAAIGTLGFMAPEQHGAAASVDGRADVYAAGATLYALLTGLEPPAVDYVVAGIEALPEALAPIVQRAMARSPADRWPSAAAMRDALGEALEQLPADPPEVPPLAPPGRPASPPRPSLAQRTSGARSEGGTTPGSDAGSSMGSGTWTSSMANEPEPAPVVAAAEPAPTAIPQAPRPPRRRVAAAGGTLAVVVIAGLVAAGLWFAPAHEWGAPTRITAFDDGVSISSADRIGDGTFVITGSEGLAVVESAVGGATLTSLGCPNAANVAAFPGGDRFLVSNLDQSMAVVSRDGTRRDLPYRGRAPAVSPDGTSIAWVSDESSGVFVAPAVGGTPRLLRSLGALEFVGPPSFSPSGDGVAMITFAHDEARIELVSTATGSSQIAMTDRDLWLRAGVGLVLWPEVNRLVVAHSGKPGSVELIELGTDGSKPSPIATLPVDSLEGLQGDAHTLVVVGSETKADVQLFTLDASGGASGPVALTHDQRREGLIGWTADNRLVYDVPTDEGRDVLVQDPTERWGTVIAKGVDRPVALIGNDLVFFGELDQPPLRFPVDAVGAIPMGPIATRRIRCSTNDICVEAALLPDVLELSHVDPTTGTRSPLARVQVRSADVRWDLERGGQAVIVTTLNGDATRVSIADGSIEPIEVLKLAQFAASRTDRDGWWLTINVADAWLLRSTIGDSPPVDVWAPSGWIASPTPSPDGRYLALSHSMFDSDVWVIERE